MPQLEDEFLKRLSEGIKPRERTDLLTWTRQYRRTEKGHKFNFTTRPYLTQIYQDAEEHKVEVIRKAAQTGGTEYAISRALKFAIEEGNITVIYTFPTATHVREFTAGRLNPSISKSPWIREKMGRVDSVSVKEIGGSFVYLRGSFGEREALSIPADMLTHDELDFSNQHRITEYQERLTASKHGYKLYFSTPTIPNFGIDALYEDSDQGEWMLDCQGCDWTGLAELELLDKATPVLRCPKCGKGLERIHGHWEFLNSGSPVRGYHFDQLSCAFVTLESILGKLEGPKAYTKKQFENFVRGRACSIGVGQVNRGVILRNCFTEGIEYSESGNNRFMGIDQNDKMSVVVSEVKSGKRNIVQVVEMDDDEDWSECHKLMHIHGVQCCVVDFRPEARLARKFVQQFPGKAFACEFVTSTKEIYFDKGEDWLVKGSRSQILDGTAAEIRAGKVQLYPLDDSIETYIAHWENLSRAESEDRLGRPTIEWVKTGTSHLSFADAYNRLAVKIMMGDMDEFSESTEVAGMVDRNGISFLQEEW